MYLVSVKFLKFVSRMRGVANCLTSHADEKPQRLIPTSTI